MDDFIGGAFDIPEQKIIEQTEESWTFGDDGKIDKKPDEPWDPLAGFLG